MRKVAIESKTRLLDDFFKVDAAQLRYERFDGQMSPLVRRLNFDRGDSVAVILFEPETQSILLVNQFKYPTFEKGPGWITEIVAGMIDGNESPEDAVRREVKEETGLDITDLQHVSTFYVSPGGSSERIVLYCAEVGRIDPPMTSGGVEAEGEDIQVQVMPLPEALKQVESGNIVDAKTILAILWLARQRADSR